jgi:hypothetical protein
VDIRVGIIIAMKREDTALIAISAADGSQVNFTTQSSEIKADFLPAVRIVSMLVRVWVGDGVRARSSLLLFMIESMCVGSILPVVRMISI